LYIENLDILDGTPLLDIKPFVPEFDGHQKLLIGWLAVARGESAPLAQMSALCKRSTENKFTKTGFKENCQIFM
jgi:tRNA (Thr-GGU) A37 N-methylase